MNQDINEPLRLQAMQAQEAERAGRFDEWLRYMNRSYDLLYQANTAEQKQLTAIWQKRHSQNV